MKILKKTQIFSSDWPELGFIRAESGLNMENRDFQELGLILPCFYVKFVGPRLQSPDLSSFDDFKTYIVICTNHF